MQQKILKRQILISVYQVVFNCPKKGCKGTLKSFKFAGQSSNGKNCYDHQCNKCGYQRCFEGKQYPYSQQVNKNQKVK